MEQSVTQDSTNRDRADLRHYASYATA